VTHAAFLGSAAKDAPPIGSAACPADVLIVGAGVGGAALALALVSRFALRVRVIDRRSGPGNINRGDSLLPAVTGVLRSLGALPALLSAGARPVHKMQVFHARHGKLLEAPLGPAIPAGALGTHLLDEDAAAPYLVLAHPEIERALVETAQHSRHNHGAAQVTYLCRLSRLLRTSEDRGRVCGAVVASEQGEEVIHARLVVGADGASSSVRTQLGLSLPTQPYDHGYYIIECARPSATTGSAAYEDAMRIELSREGGILVVPQGRDRLGLGVLVRACDEALFRAGPLSQKLAAIARRSPLLASLGQPGGLAAFPKGAHLYALQRGHAQHYHRDGAVLIGDALHVTNPTAGQGMTMAIEDAAALARRIGPVLTRAARDSSIRTTRESPCESAMRDEERRPCAFHDIDRALCEYERERWPKNAAQIRWSHWLSRFYAWDGAIGDGMHTAIFRFGATPLGQRVQRAIWSSLATRTPVAAPSVWSTP